jgi:hypothetical protein
MSYPQRPEDNYNYNHLEGQLGGIGDKQTSTFSARKRSNGAGAGSGASSSVKDVPPKAAGSARKRARGSSVSKPPNVTPPSPPRTSDHFNGNGNSTGNGNGNDNRNGHLKSAESPVPPAVLIREKKQKACANCRRAKLKCIVDDGETDCIRCKARKEKCVFYPRGHVSRLVLFVCHYHTYPDIHHDIRTHISRMSARERAKERAKERGTALMSFA